jgi:AcrR family transcriptional regulator
MMTKVKSCPVVRLVKKAYHHGDLRNALVEGAIDLMEEGNSFDFSLRDLAARVGVSAPALYSHFADKGALMVAVAITGFKKLRAALQPTVQNDKDLVTQFLDMGQAYVQFGVDNPALYDLMFASPELPPQRHVYPELKEAGDYARDVLISLLARMQEAGAMRRGEVLMDGFTVWAHVHGLASLVITGRVECAHEGTPTVQAEALPIPVQDAVRLSLTSLLDGFRQPATTR